MLWPGFERAALHRQGAVVRREGGGATAGEDEGARGDRIPRVGAASLGVGPIRRKNPRP